MAHPYIGPKKAWYASYGVFTLRPVGMGGLRGDAPLMGPMPKNSISKIWPVGEAFLGRFKHFTGPPVLSPWLPPLRAVAGLRVALSAADLSSRGED